MFREYALLRSSLLLSLISYCFSCSCSSSKSARNVILRLFFGWICENLGRRTKLNQPPKVKESSVIRYAASLLHVVCHRDDRVTGLELVNQFLNLGCGNRIQCRTRLIHQNHFRLHCERARDAEPLLLSARKARARLV